jgi:hypothetical protein
MKDEHDDADYQQYMDHASGNVKRQKPKQPKND